MMDRQDPEGLKVFDNGWILDGRRVSVLYMNSQRLKLRPIIKKHMSFERFPLVSSNSILKTMIIRKFVNNL